MLSSHELNLAPGMSPPGMLDSDSDDSDSELLTSLTQHHSHFEQLEQRNGESPSMAMANNFKHDAMRHFHLGTGDTQSLRDRAASPVEEMMMAQGMGPSSFLKEELFQSEIHLARNEVEYTSGSRSASIGTMDRWSTAQSLGAAAARMDSLSALHTVEDDPCALYQRLMEVFLREIVKHKPDDPANFLIRVIDTMKV